MTKWRVRVGGDRHDLKLLPSILPCSCSIFEEDGRFYLEFMQVKALFTAEDAHSYARGLIDAASKIACLHFSTAEPFECGEIVELRENGTRQTSEFVEAKVSARGSVRCSVTVMKADGTVDDTPKVAEFAHELDLVMNDSDVEKALSYLQYPTWNNLYNAYEVVKNDVGGQKEIYDRGWTSRSLLSRFCHAAQKARHAVQRGTPPAKPLPLAEAQRLICKLLDHWVQEKAQH